MAVQRVAAETNLVSGLLKGAGDNFFGWRQERGYRRWFLAEIQEGNVVNVVDIRQAPQKADPAGVISVTGAEKIEGVISGNPSCVTIV